MKRARKLITIALLTFWAGTFGPARAQAQAERADRDKQLVEIYRKMLREDPNQDYALRRLLEVSHAVGGLKGLIDIYTKALEAAPKSFPDWMVLGHIHRAAEDVDKASAAYAKAAELDGKSAAPHIATAELYRRVQDWAKALAAYDRAIPLVRDKVRKQDTLKAAAEVALENEERERAERYFEKLIKTEPRNLFLRMEHAATLARHGEHERALKAWLDIKKRAGNNLKHLVIVWKEVAELQERLDRHEEAEKTWREALEKTPKGHWSRSTFLEGLIGLHRRQDRLRELIEEFEKKADSSHEMLVTLARLYEEIAEDDKALELFQKAVAKRPSDTRSRLAAIRLLERVGKPEDVITAYKALIRASPGEPRYELKLAELYFHRGRIDDGFDLLSRMERRYRDDPGVHQAIIDLTMRYGDRRMRPRIESAYRRLMRLEPREPSHVISLGEYYWTEGNRSKALATWKKLLSMGAAKGEGHFLLAEVYADHEMYAEARDAYEKALQADPGNERFAKSYALMLQKQRKWGRALDQWERVVRTSNKSTTVREARRQIIQLWDKAGRLGTELTKLERRFGGTPPDVDAGKFLATAYLMKRRLGAARKILERLRELKPDDIETLVGLEMVYTRQNELKKAITVLEQLAKLNSRGASEYMHRAADLALSMGDDKLALKYMRQVVELDPADPKAHSRVGELYRRMGHLGEAAEAWRQSLVLDPRNHPVQFKLASLYRDMGNLLREEQVLGDIVREAADPADTLRAGRRLLEVAQTTGRLEAVEEIIRPLVFNRRNKNVYLKLLVNLYQLIAQHHAYSDAPRRQREAALRRVGERGLKPLLDALLDQDMALRANALDVLMLARPAGAAPALARLAEESEDRVKMRATVALGRVGTTSAAASLSRLADIGGKKESRQIAVWALGLVASEEVDEALESLVKRQDMQRHALLAIGRRARPTAVQAIEQLVATAQDDGTRHAALWALGRMAQARSVPTLEANLRVADATEVSLAAWGLARIGGAKATRALVGALWLPTTRAADVIAAALLRVGRPMTDEAAVEAAYDAMVKTSSSGLGVDDNPQELYAVSRVRPIDGAPARDAVERLRARIEARLAEVLGGPDRGAVEQLLRALLGAGDALQLAPLVLADGDDPAGETLTVSLIGPHASELLDAAAGKLGDRVQGPALRVLGRLVDHRVAGVTAAQIAALALESLRSTRPDVRLAAAHALARVAKPGDARVVSAVADAIGDPEMADDWLLRAALAEVLGRVGTEAAESLISDMLRDPVAAVRRAAATAAGAIRTDALVPVVIDLLTDPVPDVARAALEALAAMRDRPRVEAAIQRVVQQGDPRLAPRAREILAARTPR